MLVLEVVTVVRGGAVTASLREVYCCNLIRFSHQKYHESSTSTYELVLVILIIIYKMILLSHEVFSLQGPIRPTPSDYHKSQSRRLQDCQSKLIFDVFVNERHISAYTSLNELDAISAKLSCVSVYKPNIFAYTSLNKLNMIQVKLNCFIRHYSSII